MTWFILVAIGLVGVIILGAIKSSSNEAPEGRTLTKQDVYSIADEHGVEILADDVTVVGTDHRPDAMNEFIRAINTAGANGKGMDELSIRLEREPDNQHDQFAIKVFGEWDYRKKSRHIGYVPRKLAYKIGQQVDDDEPLHAFLSSIAPDEDGRANIKFHIGVSSS